MADPSHPPSAEDFEFFLPEPPIVTDPVADGFNAQRYAAQRGYLRALDDLRRLERDGLDAHSARMHALDSGMDAQAARDLYPD